VKRFVRLKFDDQIFEGSRVFKSEYALAKQELSLNGVYRVLKTEEDCGEKFYLLVGGKAWYSASLFEEVST
jgi:hypothetical protein